MIEDESLDVSTVRFSVFIESFGLGGTLKEHLVHS